MIGTFGLIPMYKTMRRECRLTIGELDLLTTKSWGGITIEQRLDILKERLYCPEIDEYEFNPENPDPRL